MLAALRDLVHRRDGVSIDESFLGDGYDLASIFAPEGIESSSDAGALSLAAFFAGVRLRAGLISSMPLRWEIDGIPQKELPPILEQPDPTETVAVTIKRMAASLSLRGNAIAPLGGFDDRGFPTVLKVVHPAQVTAKATKDGPVYQVAGTEYRFDQVLHARGLTLPGAIMAISPIEACRRDINSAATVREYGRRWFRRSGVPSVVVKVNRPRDEINESELAKLKAKWAQLTADGRQPIFVPGDLEVNPLSISNEDSQFLATRKLSITDIANIVGVPGYFIGADGSSRTYTNMQDERRALLDFYLREDIEAIEDAFTALLPVGRAKFDPATFLRMDTKTTAETLAIEGQWLTIDELREIAGRPPLPDGAGKVLARTSPRQPDSPSSAPPDPTPGGGT